MLDGGKLSQVQERRYLCKRTKHTRSAVCMPSMLLYTANVCGCCCCCCCDVAFIVLCRAWMKC
jgi:hypothetical protein